MEDLRKSYNEIVDLLVRGATPAELLAFQPSEESKGRVQYLLARNRNNELTVEEVQELERLGDIEHFMQQVKARARLFVKNRT